MPSWTRQWGEGPLKLKLLGFLRVLVATAQASRKDIPEVRSWWEGVVSGNAEGWEPLMLQRQPKNSCLPLRALEVFTCRSLAQELHIAVPPTGEEVPGRTELESLLFTLFFCFCSLRQGFSV